MKDEPVLLVDIGNSRVKWGLGKGGSILLGQPFPSNYQKLGGELRKHWASLAPPAAVFVANVAGESQQQTLLDWSQSTWGISARFVATDSGPGHGVYSGYEDPATLGVDRWLAIVAAHRLFAGPVCVADCGTAITIDAVDGNGRHLGGAIAPGLTLLRQSLLGEAVGLRNVAGGRPVLLARNTADALQGGAMLMAAGAIERFMRQVGKVLPGSPHLLLTGGDAGTIGSELKVSHDNVPDLVLKGLLTIAEGDS